jgi:DNA-binding PadR family transcriptional regulator
VEKAGQRRKRCYRLTAEGQKVLRQQRGRWESFVSALTKAAGLRHA